MSNLGSGVKAFVRLSRESVAGSERILSVAFGFRRACLGRLPRARSDGERAETATCDLRYTRPDTVWVRLHVVGGPAPPETARVSVNVMVTARESATTEINVIGCSVDEALTRLERFFDDLLLTDERQVRIIHGFGTGQLRRGIGEYLDRHPLVASHQPAPHDKGGGGVTVAELKD